jgi:RNA recognition motif-containing protein
MSKKLYVGGLSWETDESLLRSTFEAYGELDEVKVISDRDTGRSRGFGFVTFADRKQADEAIAALDGKQLDGRTITVNEARDRGDSRGGGGGGGGRRGGGGGGHRY